MTAPVRTIRDVDRDLDKTALTLHRAMRRHDANAAELAGIRIDQLLDERLTLST